MAGPVARRVFWAPLYNGTAVASLRLAAVLALALGVGGCAVSGPLGSMFARAEQGRSPCLCQRGRDRLGRRSGRDPGVGLDRGLPSETDLVFARMAIVDVLKRGSKEISAPWENPRSGAHGTVTPIASAYNKDGATCRDFLASYVRRQGSETWLQGEACRAKQGVWEVKSLRPWSRS